MSFNLETSGDDDFCYLTTTGRISGKLHTIEIWFALSGKTLYMLAGGREKADWVKNALHTSQVQVKISGSTLKGLARTVDNEEEDARARKLVFDKYTPRDNDDLTEWARTALPMAIHLEV